MVRLSTPRDKRNTVSAFVRAGRSERLEPANGAARPIVDGSGRRVAP